MTFNLILTSTFQTTGVELLPTDLKFYQTLFILILTSTFQTTGVELLPTDLKFYQKFGDAKV